MRSPNTVFNESQNVYQPAAPSPAEMALSRGLFSISKSTAQIADAVRNNPAEIPTALGSAEGIAKQFAELTDRASKYADEGKRFGETAAEVERATGWIGSNYPSGAGNQSVSVANSFGRVVGSFAEL